MDEKVIKGYKGFNSDLTCRNFQYEVGKTYETNEAKVCKNGFHFCENPFDVFRYYPPCDDKGISRYCEVDASGEMDRDSNDSKISCSIIKIGAEIELNGIIKAGVRLILDKIKWNGRSQTNTGEYSAATNTGNCSAATNTGNRSAATNTGNRSLATNTGDYSAAESKGEDSIAIVTGYKSKARGAIGNWIVLTERDDDNSIIEIKAFKVDGEKIKENTFYTLENGEAKEV